MTENVVHLGKVSKIPIKLDPNVLDRVPNVHFDEGRTNYVARFVCPEFTSLCPITEQPDFAHIVLDYVPGRWLIESKALKLFLFSFRNHGGFHEDVSLTILKELYKVAEPRWMKISAFWAPGGGIPIEVFAEKGELPENVVVPDPGVTPYRGRG